jgi:hypothetical protein
VKSVTDDFLLRLAEPSVSPRQIYQLSTIANRPSSQTIKLTLTSQASQNSALELEGLVQLPTEGALVERLAGYNQRRIDSRNVAYEGLVPQLLAVTQSSKSHWRYVLTAAVCTPPREGGPALTYLTLLALPQGACKTRSAAQP